MIWFYLFFAILMNDGTRPVTLGYNFASIEECNKAGEVFAAHVKADKDIKQAGWLCLPTDFDAIDPIPDSPVTPPKHTPGKDEA